MIKASWVGIGRVLLVNAGIILLSAWIGVSLNRAFVAGPQQSTYSYSNETGRFQPVKASEGQSTEVLEEVQLRTVREIISSKSMMSGTGNGPGSDSPGYSVIFTGTRGWFGGTKTKFISKLKSSGFSAPMEAMMACELEAKGR